jgi:transposase
MSLPSRRFDPVPPETARVAHAAFPKGNAYLTLRDELGLLYEDREFECLFAWRGRPAESPAILAMVTVIQFAEGLSDRQAAEATHSRIDIKYLLGMELTDCGFDYSLLSEFRERLLAGGKERQLLDILLMHFKERGVLKSRGQQRTDSTHVLAAVRALNRLELVGETLRSALNILAVVAPEWLQAQVRPDWFERYGVRVEQYRLPKSKKERTALIETIGVDGYQLLAAVYSSSAPCWLCEVPAVQVLRQVWVQQYYQQGERVKWREGDNLAPSAVLIESPYDPEAHYSNKRSVDWEGYKVHLTEVCDVESPHLITHVETRPATEPDDQIMGIIHSCLADKELLPQEHFVDAGYPDADHLVDSRSKYQIDVVGPVQGDSSWQARAGQGFDLSCFKIDWEAHQVTCPQGQASRVWSFSKDTYSHEVIHIHFDTETCLRCACRSQCTRAKKGPRTLKLRARTQHLALQTARQRQSTSEFKERYKIRAGVEGTISHGVRCMGLRQTRYIGLAKTHLQNIAIAAAINLNRIIAWLNNKGTAQTRTSRFAALASAI